MQKVKCPKCGNAENFSLTLRYLRLAVTYKQDKGYYSAMWEEGEPDVAYCACCHTELDPEDVSYLYSNSNIE
ncbi:hypothetical protein H0A61_02889 [Koleobacter methoxysyntrophicus]|uniref:Uncharacterized protein n=1 Tax=Koleobacter methoxysyntrophicus TaxID=2751313 RepID=A0A8A0RQ28_9FIRM|nr:hypothetical protein [Koleobacter methoxysyntrophicus]QSQ10481.1 hypothetical protein H0A61_02889 [Koleobacter methoxysyntrophicus]